MSELAFLAAGASQGLVASFAKARGIAAVGTFGPVGGIRDRFLGGEACDVLILTHAQVCGLVATRALPGGLCSDLGAVRTSLAVRARDEIPDISHPDLLRAAVEAADAIHFPDPAKATAGAHWLKVLEGLGIPAPIQARSRVHAGGMASMVALAAGPGRSIGVAQATEILASSGVQLAGHLPRPFHLSTVYTAAVSPAAPRRDEALQFVNALAGSEAAGRRFAAGFESPSIRRGTRDDEPAIRELVFGVLQEYAIKPDPEGTDADLFDLDANYFARGGMFDVAYDIAGKLVGCCGTFAADDATSELRKMYVRKDQRGAGLGQRLLDRAIAFARARRSAELVLETASVLKEAAAMYEKAGFVRQLREPHVKRCDRAYSLALAS